MLSLSNLRKSFGNLVAVDHLSLEIHRGEVFGLLGPNGAGKTTTISMAIGLLRPDAGTVDVDGRGSPLQAEVRRLIGVAPQSLALYDELTAEENLRFFGKLYGLGSAILRRRVDDLLGFVGLSDRRRDRVRGYSGGMKRRLNLAIALVHDPALVLLDEPTVGVDPQSRNAIFEFVASLKRQGRTIIYTTHYMEEAQRLCDRVGIIDRGRLLALDTVTALIEQQGQKSVVVVEHSNGEERIETNDPKGELVRILTANNDVRGVHIDRPDLESVFLALTGRRLRD
jgi:ABC-2 type transport system ATP-binding protein